MVNETGIEYIVSVQDLDLLVKRETERIKEELKKITREAFTSLPDNTIKRVSGMMDSDEVIYVIRNVNKDGTYGDVNITRKNCERGRCFEVSIPVGATNMNGNYTTHELTFDYKGKRYNISSVERWNSA